MCFSCGPGFSASCPVGQFVVRTSLNFAQPLSIVAPRYRSQVPQGGPMKNYVRASLVAALMLTAAAAAHGQVSIGIAIGAPPPPRVLYVEPPAPGPEFVWVGGYWYPIGNHYRWHEGYWTRPPYEGAHWIAPHHDGERFFAGYWAGDRGRVDHD